MCFGGAPCSSVVVVHVNDATVVLDAVEREWERALLALARTSDDGTPGRSRLLRLKLLVFGGLC